MIILTKTYENGHIREYRVNGATQAGASVVIHTQHDGDVCISATDTPDLWQQLMDSDMEIAIPAITKQRLKEYAAEHRYKIENSGVVFGGMPIPTDDRSKILINGVYNKAIQENDPQKERIFKIGGSFTEINNSQVLLIGQKIADHVQKCFDAEAHLNTLIDEDEVKSFEETETAFNHFMEE